MDSGAGANVISLEAFRKLKMPEDRVKPFFATFGGFIGGIFAQASGSIDVTMTLGQGDHRRTEKITLHIMRDLSGYNIYLGRPGINAFQAVCSMYYLKMKFLTRSGELVTALGSQKVARMCEVKITEGFPEDDIVKTTGASREYKEGEIKAWTQHAEPGGALAPLETPKEVPLKLYSSKYFKIGNAFDCSNQKRLMRFQEKRRETFAWSPKEMPGISADIIQHSLNVDPKAPAIR